MVEFLRAIDGTRLRRRSATTTRVLRRAASDLVLEVACDRHGPQPCTQLPTAVFLGRAVNFVTDKHAIARELTADFPAASFCGWPQGRQKRIGDQEFSHNDSLMPETTRWPRPLAGRPTHLLSRPFAKRTGASIRLFGIHVIADSRAWDRHHSHHRFLSRGRARTERNQPTRVLRRGAEPLLAAEKR